MKFRQPYGPLSRAGWWARLALLGGLLLLAAGITYSPLLGHFLAHTGQDPAYHNFADDRTLLGIPNFLNVISNIPFLLAGVLGLWFVFTEGADRRRETFLDARERWPFVVLFSGVGLTAFGSAYYHWAPANDSLVWDRLPMTLAFMGLCAGVIAERIDLEAGLWLLGPLVLLGLGSVAYWIASEHRGQGDLRLYGLVQFYPLVALPLVLLLFPPRYTGAGYLWGALVWYGLAKVLELHFMDRGIYELGHVVSGHTLKHLAAAAGAWWVVRMLRARKPAVAEVAVKTPCGAPR
jgi:hypothetical protein